MTHFKIFFESPDKVAVDSDRNTSFRAAVRNATSSIIFYMT